MTAPLTRPSHQSSKPVHSVKWINVKNVPAFFHLYSVFLTVGYNMKTYLFFSVCFIYLSCISSLSSRSQRCLPKTPYVITLILCFVLFFFFLHCLFEGDRSGSAHFCWFRIPQSIFGGWAAFLWLALGSPSSWAAGCSLLCLSKVVLCAAWLRGFPGASVTQAGNFSSSVRDLTLSPGALCILSYKGVPFCPSQPSSHSNLVKIFF